MAEPDRLFTRHFLLLIGAHFLQALGYSSLLLFPLYVDHLGANRGGLGLIMATAPLAGLLFRPVVAWSLDSLGRKPSLIIGTAFLVAGMWLIALVDDLGVLIYLDRVLVGMGTAMLFTGYFTWASDLIPASRRTEGLAIFGASGLLPVGFNAFAHEVVVDPADLQSFFPWIGAAIAVSFLFIALLPEPAGTGGDRDESARTYRPREVLRAVSKASLWPVWLATAVFSGLVAVFMTFATVTAESRIPSGEGLHFFAQPASLWLPYAIAAMSVRLIGGRLPDRVGAHNMVAPALALYVTAFLLAAGADQPIEWLIAGGIGGFAHGYCFPVLISQVVSRSPERWRGSAIAFYTALWGVSNLVLVPVMGHVADLYGDSNMYTSASLGAIVCLALWCLLEHRLGAKPALAARGAGPASLR